MNIDPLYFTLSQWLALGAVITIMLMAFDTPRTVLWAAVFAFWAVLKMFLMLAFGVPFFP